MSTQMVEKKADAFAVMENVVIQGNLAQLTPEQRVMYYRQVCESVGLNPLTKPFEYITLNGKLTLYARRDATDQLRQLHGVSIEDMAETEREGVYIVTVKAKNKDGRTDMAKGAVTISNLKGDALANAMMKAETKAKRRVTLSICGLGVLDETEIGTIQGAESILVNAVTGEIEGNEESPASVKISTTAKQEFAKQMREALATSDELGARQIWDEWKPEEHIILWKLFSPAEKSSMKELLGMTAKKLESSNGSA